ncbi:hypothetical protein Efla_003845 [Eimeria flavescens]
MARLFCPPAEAPAIMQRQQQRLWSRLRAAVCSAASAFPPHPPLRPAGWQRLQQQASAHAGQKGPASSPPPPPSAAAQQRTPPRVHGGTLDSRAGACCQQLARCSSARPPGFANGGHRYSTDLQVRTAGAPTQPQRRFTSAADSTDPGHVVLSKERLEEERRRWSVSVSSLHDQLNYTFCSLREEAEEEAAKEEGAAEEEEARTPRRTVCVCAADQLLLAEITEFALRPSRPLTLEQIAFLNETQQEQHRQQCQQQASDSSHAGSSSSSSSHTSSSSSDSSSTSSSSPQSAVAAGGAQTGDRLLSRAGERGPCNVQRSSPACGSVLGGGDLLAAGEAPPLWGPSRGPLGTGANSFAEFLYHELPVRFASRVKQLESLPLFHTEPLIMQVRHTYVESFKKLRTSCSCCCCCCCCQVVFNLKKRHAPIVPMVVTGIRNLREVVPQFFTEKYVDEFLDGFFLSRIGTEMLTSSYLTSNGVVDMGCCSVCLHADAEKLCHSHYGTCPQIEIWNYNEAHFATVPQYLYYILSELLKNALRATMEHHPSQPAAARVPPALASGDRGPLSGGPAALWQAEAHRVACIAQHPKPSWRSPRGGRCSHPDPHYRTAEEIANPHMPPVQLLVAGDDHSISIRLSDMGGGIAAETQPRIWSYMYTTARPVKYDPKSGVVMSAPAQQQQQQLQQQTGRKDDSLKQSVTIGSLDFTTRAEKKELLASPLAGFGCGLPLCRLYASYLGGSLTLVSMPVYGTDAYVHLRRIGDQQVGFFSLSKHT